MSGNPLTKIQWKKSPNIFPLLEHPIICITGTSTGVGKTIATGLLARGIQQYQSVVTQKWVQSGDLNQPDIQTHKTIASMSVSESWATKQQVYSFSNPVSPHLAAAMEHSVIDTKKLIQATEALSLHSKTVLLETSGGIMVPLTPKETFGDLISKMNIPIIIVVPNQLGVINHTLLTLHYLRAKHIPILGFLLNEFNAYPSEMTRDNPSIIKKMGKIEWLGTF